MDAPSTRRPPREGLEYLGAVAGGLVHEVRNPLSTMNVTLQLLQEDWKDAEPDERSLRTMRRLTAIRREVTRLEEILDDFLRYAGMRRLNLARVDLNRVLEEVTAFVAPECARAHVTLRFYPDRSLPLISLDERLIKQAALNLILNAVQAIEAMPDAGDAEREIIVRSTQEAGHARVDVIDTGPGIPEALQEQVFEIYFSRREEGSGLGLPTARRIAEEHSGTLDLESEVGKGTDFILRIPLTMDPPK